MNEIKKTKKTGEDLSEDMTRHSRRNRINQ